MFLHIYVKEYKASGQTVLSKSISVDNNCV